MLTQWSEHVVKIADRLTASGVDPIVMTGSMGKKARAAAVDELAAKVELGEQVVLVATGSLLGEGFDSPALDTDLHRRSPVRMPEPCGHGRRGHACVE